MARGGGVVKPPVPYYGSKASIASWIVSLLPDHAHYVEPFAGSLAVLLAKAPSPMETVNDLDEQLVTFWRVLRDRPSDLARVCAFTPHSRAEMTAAYQSSDDDLEAARRVWVLLTQGRASNLRTTGWRHFATTSGSATSMPDYLHGYRARLLPVAERLMAVSLECRPADDVIASYGRHEDVLLYVDPPYLGETRSSAGYRHEMRSATEHRLMAEQLLECRAAVVLSGYDSPLYDDLFAGWFRHTLTTQTSQGGAGSARTEVVWCNRPPRQASLFDEGVA
ncbi:MAG: DNA adenine methylase [Nocardioidaceae bacterium]|nr:DNA adenine methylase [Nocardioidaceae bacterium]